MDGQCLELRSGGLENFQFANGGNAHGSVFAEHDANRNRNRFRDSPYRLKGWGEAAGIEIADEFKAVRTSGFGNLGLRRRGNNDF